MAFDVVLPNLGDSITEVVLTKKVRKEGEFVTGNELLCELEGDKVSFDVQATHSGIVHWLAEEEEIVAVGAVLCTIRYTGSSPAVSKTTVIDLTNGPVEIRLKK